MVRRPLCGDHGREPTSADTGLNRIRPARSVNLQYTLAPEIVPGNDGIVFALWGSRDWFMR
jgi:hypothetical protein